MSSSSTSRPLIVGEVLFDCFSDHRVLGGAPFNVAWNLKGLGLEPLVVTAIGQDDLGNEVIENMNYWKMDLSGVQVLPGIPTGRVDIQVEEGQPSYTFWSDVAFDQIPLHASTLSQQSFGLFYHGSLALRGMESRNSVTALRRRVACPVFIDVNIRQPHFDWKIFEPFLFEADHLKLNDQELMQLLFEQGMAAPQVQTVSWAERRGLASDLMAKYRIQNLWLTAGHEGAAWLGPAGQYFQQDAPPVSQLVDTVGAGDALAAVIIWSILTGRSPEEALIQAVAFAARVCSLRGAITREADFYRLDSRT